MKVIVLGDIHGNLPALEVALREARAEGYDRLVHTGDLVGYAPFPRETIALVRAQRIPGVRGDVDEGVAAELADPGEAIDPGRREFESRAYAWTLQHTDRADRRFLGNLPFDERMDLGRRRAVLHHATPIDAYTALLESRDEASFREMGDAARAEIIIFGHTHRSYHRIVDGRHFVNAGSVGYPQDGDPRTGYVVIKANGNVEIEYRRFPYEIERVRRAAAERGFPRAAQKVFRA